ncbi:MAG TPA: GTP 3',8-cyclase MoaA [Candidatus Limnocylindria bacterium]|nr:GTP 3',8-cyclase MoaA [Candidatus Limnocylindria bacterium]
MNARAGSFHRPNGLVDPYGRKINYLRISVTDHCNLRCRYCVPGKPRRQDREGEPLSYKDLFRISRSAVSLGIEKIRVTGGEPLLRPGITGFLSRLGGIPGLRNLVVTTNGVNLEKMAEGLAAAGVRGINISCDSLRPGVYARITRGGDARRVFAGIAAAEKAGFPSLKINVVVMRGVNCEEIPDFAALTLEKPYAVRFIEYMPTTGARERAPLLVTGSEIVARIAKRFRLSRLTGEDQGGPARRYKIPGAAGTIGLITPLSCSFCVECSRIRVSAAGIARSCLFSAEGMDLRPVLASGDDARLEETLQGIVSRKPAGHALSLEGSARLPFPMSQMGG